MALEAAKRAHFSFISRRRFIGPLPSCFCTRNLRYLRAEIKAKCSRSPADLFYVGVDYAIKPKADKTRCGPNRPAAFIQGNGR